MRSYPSVRFDYYYYCSVVAEAVESLTMLLASAHRLNPVLDIMKEKVTLEGKTSKSLLNNDAHAVQQMCM